MENFYDTHVIQRSFMSDDILTDLAVILKDKRSVGYDTERQVQQYLTYKQRPALKYITQMESLDKGLLL